MKRFLPTVIGLTLTVSASANGELKDGWLILEDFESQPTLVTHNFQAGNGKTAVLAYTADPSGATGMTLDVSGAQWQEVVELDITLPAGKTIADYAQVAFDYYVIKGNYKKIKIMIDDSELYYSSGYGEATSSKKWIEFSTAIPESMTSGNKLKLRFGVDSGESGSQYYYDNVRLLPKADVSGESQNGTLNGDIYMVEDFEASIMGASYTVLGGAKASVSDNPSGSGVVAKVVNSSYSAFPQFEVTLPDGKTLGNVRNVMFDVYVPTDVATQPSDPTFKQRRIAINGTEVYYDVKEDGSTQDYPDCGAADKWATVSLELNKLDKLTDALKAPTEFKLAVGIHDDAITYYIDNVRLQLGEPVETPDEPVDEEVLMTTLDYISSVYPVQGRYVTSLAQNAYSIASKTSLISKIAVKSGSYASLTCGGEDVMQLKISQAAYNYTDISLSFSKALTAPGDYKVVIPAGVITFTNKADGSTFTNPAMYYSWTIVEKACKGTEEEPIESLSFVFDMAKESNYNFLISPELGESYLWYKVYVVGWVSRTDMQAHFDSDGVASTYYATLLSDDVNTTDPSKCVWYTTKTGANLSLDGTYGRDTFHKRYLTKYSKFDNYTYNGVTFVRGGLTKSDMTEIPDPGQSAIDIIGTDGQPESVTVYNLQGMQVLNNASPESLSTLPAGLYIVNGKKMVIR